MRSRRNAYAFITRHRYGVVLAFIGFVFIVTNLNLLGFGGEVTDSSKLREDILRLSEMYVNILSKEEQDIVNGPFSGHLTGHDLHKTFAVILENLLNRISRLERELVRLNTSSCIKNSSSAVNGDKFVGNSLTISTISRPDGAVDTGVKSKGNESCPLTEEEKARYPHCLEKMAWMALFWSSDPCYSAYGVDGSDCSFRIYLSEAESWCPPLPGRDQISAKPFSSSFKAAEWNFELDSLLYMLQDPGHRRNYEWMRNRITFLWSRWVFAAKKLTLKQDFANRQQQRILIHLGFLSSKSGFKIPETASKGGPLGELVQWSDVISALYLLGHRLIITSEFGDLIDVLNQLPNAEAQCQVRSLLPVDMIYTDIVGLMQFKRKVKSGYGKFSCLLRILDSFGTEAMFNSASYAKLHRRSTNWGKQNLNLRQFFTMFPHSPDNSFMGFVVEQHLMDVGYNNVTKRQQAVVYGKDARMWSGKKEYLSVIKKYVDIHGTVFLERDQNNSNLPNFVRNHGILSGPELHRLLYESKLFIGLGFPYEGPAPLEAIALGCVFINPKFSPPQNSENTAFFKGKPTLRKLTSQHPYAEDFISEPHVYTVNISNLDEVETVVKKALDTIDNKKVDMYLPYEFTHEGMLQRLNAYIQHQDFCSVVPNIWPPVSSVSHVASAPGQSCKDACWKQGKICEYSHFHRLNVQTVLERLLNASCSDVKTQSDIYFPAFENGTRRCFIQGDALLFSCVGEVEGVSRACPCRDFIKGQTALCSKCL